MPGSLTASTAPGATLSGLVLPLAVLSGSDGPGTPDGGYGATYGAVYPAPPGGALILTGTTAP